MNDIDIAVENPISMTWNHRVVRHHDKHTGEIYYQIHEVYYDADEKIIGMTEGGMEPFGETTTELQLDLERMLGALTKPVLDYGVTDGKPEEWDESKLTPDEKHFVEYHENLKKLMWPDRKED